MLFDFIVAISCVVIGLSLGWVAHALYRSGALSNLSSVETPAPDPSAGGAVPAPEVVDTISPEKVTAVAGRIRNFAATIAASIDSHQTKVDAVSSSLNAFELTGASPVIVDAVEQLLSANELMREQLQASQERLREQSKQLESAEQRAQTDALTGVTNRGAFDERLTEQFALGPNRAAVLVLADIDYFKRFNDEHGHRAGDEVLRSVARMLEARLEPYGTVARFGGEEFSVLVDSDNFEETLELIEETRIAVSTREIRFEGKRLKVSLSVGIGRLEADQTEGDWLQRVDDALYRSKECGRDCSHYVAGERLLRVEDRRSQPDSSADLKSDSTAPSLSKPIGTDTRNLVSSSQPTPALETEQAVQTAVTSIAQVAQDAMTPTDRKTAPVESPSMNRASAGLSPVADKIAPIDELANTLSAVEATERPKALSYLPDRDSLIDGILETLEARHLGSRPHYMVAVTLSGKPSGALMRSLLQIVRAAMRSQDRIGCVNHNTLMIHLAECDTTDVRQRVEQICLSAGSVGVQLASPQGSRTNDRLSIGVLQLADMGTDSNALPSIEALENTIIQSQAAAMLAGRQGEESGELPILIHEMSAHTNI